MSERRRSAVALSSRAHAFSVEALIGTNKKRKLRDWEDKGLDLSMESLSPNGQLGDNEDPTQCLDLNPGGGCGHPGSALLRGRVTGSSEQWRPAAHSRSSGSFSRDRTRWAPAGAASLRSRDGSAGGCGGGTSPEGKRSRQGKGSQRVRGTARSAAPLPSLAPPGSRGVWPPGPRPQGRRDGVRGEGAQHFPLGVRTLNFQLSFVYFYLKGIR
uniref:T-box transcription factor 15 n=2 Tax=Passeriformes TaxID=9126 RepID=A0A674HLD4_TAEGU